MLVCGVAGWDGRLGCVNWLFILTTFIPGWCIRLAWVCGSVAAFERCVVWRKLFSVESEAAHVGVVSVWRWQEGAKNKSRSSYFESWNSETRFQSAICLDSYSDISGFSCS